jgi:hypothetical protein
MVVMVAGIGAAWRSTDAIARSLGLALLVGLAFLPSVQAVSTLAERPVPYGARPVLTEFARNFQPGDAVIVDASSEPTFRFYRNDAQLRGLANIEPTRTENDLHNPESLAAEARRHHGQPRVWLIFSDHMGDPGGRESKFLELTLDSIGRRKVRIEAPGYSAELRDFSGPTPLGQTDSPRRLIQPIPTPPIIKRVSEAGSGTATDLVGKTGENPSIEPDASLRSP